MIGLRIKQLRLHKGWTQQQLVGNRYSLTYLSRVEHDDIKVSNEFAEYVADHLNIPKTDLLMTNLEDISQKIGNIYQNFRQSGEISDH